MGIAIRFLLKQDSSPFKERDAGRVDGVSESNVFNLFLQKIYHPNHICILIMRGI
ncbi:hypothetical protein J2Y03_001058 [Neobacillus niacini]|nr:hypothetical protein [Neobacillus niacini]